MDVVDKTLRTYSKVELERLVSELGRDFIEKIYPRKKFIDLFGEEEEMLITLCTGMQTYFSKEKIDNVVVSLSSEQDVMDQRKYVYSIDIGKFLKSYEDKGY